MYLELRKCWWGDRRKVSALHVYLKETGGDCDASLELAQGTVD